MSDFNEYKITWEAFTGEDGKDYYNVVASLIISRYSPREYYSPVTGSAEKDNLEEAITGALNDLITKVGVCAMEDEKIRKEAEITEKKKQRERKAELESKAYNS